MTLVEIIATKLPSTLLHSQLEIDSNELIFIDYSQRSLNSAEERGFTLLLLTTYQQLVSDLEKI